MSAARRVVVPLCSRGTQHRASVSLNPQTIAFMELLKTEDSQAMKNKWRCFGFKDVTPFWGQTSKVETFNKREAVARWFDFQPALRDVDADWYYLSGHHATRYAEEQDLHPDRVTDAGFFNEGYHDRTWATGSEFDYSKADLFVSTTHLPSSSPGLTRAANPVFERIRPKCKGVIMMGCNTLTYRQVRRTLRTVFPNALIIGFLSTTPAGPQAYLPIDGKCRRDFFETPPKKPAELLEWAAELNRDYKRRTLALQSGDLLVGVHKRLHTPVHAQVDDDARHVFTTFGLIDP